MKEKINKNYKIFLTTLLAIFFIKIHSNCFASSVVSGISNNKIDIDSNFKGTEILLFGAKGDAGDIIIAVRGPKKNFLVTHKEKTIGVWHNGTRIKIEDLYSYYALFSTFNNIDETNQMLENLELGRNNLIFKSSLTDKTLNNPKNKILEEEFYNSLVENLEQNHLYLVDANKIDFLDETLFKVMLQFPKNIPQGTYAVEIYLIRDDNLLSFQSIPIYVNQIGINAEISNFCYQQPLLYALFAIIIALLFGWLANILFIKFFGK